MTIKKSLSLTFLSTIFPLLIFLIFFFLVDPTEDKNFALIILLFSLFLFLLGFFTLAFVILKFRALKEKEKIFEKFSSAFRQALFFSLFIISLFILHYFKILQFLTFIISFLFFFLFELIFSTRRKKFIYK
jgi:hypothetical protein